MSSEHNWIELFSAAALGGGVVKVLDRSFDFFAHLSGKRTAAQNLLNRHLDPVIKAAEELSSKLRFLAQADFQPIVEAKKTTPQSDLSGQQLIETGSLLYLFLQFWGETRNPSRGKHIYRP